MEFSAELTEILQQDVFNKERIRVLIKYTIDHLGEYHVAEETWIMLTKCLILAMAMKNSQLDLEEIDLVLELLRNMCVNPTAQERTFHTSIHAPIADFLVNLIESNDENNGKTIRIGVQMLSNSITQNSDIQNVIWPYFVNESRLIW